MDQRRRRISQPRGADVITARAVGDVLVTQDGYDRLGRELERLTTIARRDVAERLRVARGAGGDPAENGELMDALEEQILLEQRISHLEARLASARVVAAAVDGTAGIGTRVRVRSRTAGIVEYELVGAGEADAGDGRISIDSPVGQAIAGRRAGETIEVETPRRMRRLELLSVEPAGAGTELAQAA
jgi:transcription elongation factor GreA